VKSKDAFGSEVVMDGATSESTVTSSSSKLQSSSVMVQKTVPATSNSLFTTTASPSTTTLATTSASSEPSQSLTTSVPDLGKTQSSQSSSSVELVSGGSETANDEVDGDMESSVTSIDSSKSVDISTDSVSSALSVLLKSTPVLASTAAAVDPELPSSPKSAYRYAANRSAAVSGLYRRKLGSSSLDQYSRNIDQLYGSGSEDFFSTTASKLGSSVTSDGDMSSPSISSTGSPCDFRPFANLVMSPSTLSPVLSSPVISFRGADSGSTQRKMVARPTVPPPPPPSGDPSRTPGTPPAAPSADAKPPGVATDPSDPPRPRCVAPHIARRAFLYGDIESPTSEELKSLDAAVEGINPTLSPKSPDSDPSAYSPLSDFATLYIDDEDWRSYSEPPVRLPFQGRVGTASSSSFRARRSLGRTPKSVHFDPRALFLSAAADGELDVLRATAAKVKLFSSKILSSNILVCISVCLLVIYSGLKNKETVCSTAWLCCLLFCC